MRPDSIPLSAKVPSGRARALRHERTQPGTRDVIDTAGPARGTCRSLADRLVALAGELERLAASPAHSPLRGAAELLAKAAVQLDARSFELCPHAILDVGLAHALARLAREHATLDLSVEVIERGRERRLTSQQARFSFRAARELLLNALKHARASRVTIDLEWRADALRLVVRDDGHGMRTAQPWLTGGLGLFDLRARLLGLGGGLEVDSTPGGGTAIALAIPLASARWDARRTTTPGPDGALAPEDRARRQLARDLHDSVGQLLPAIKLEIDAHASRSHAPEVLAVAARIAALNRDVRLLTFELYPAMLDDLGLRATLAHYATRLASTGATVHVHEAGSRGSLGHARTLFAFQATRALLQAVLRAQHRAEIVVALSWRASGLRICVDAPLAPAPDARDLALRDLRERAARLGGDLRAEASEGVCVRYTLDVPPPACALERAPVTTLAMAG